MGQGWRQTLPVKCQDSSKKSRLFFPPMLWKDLTVKLHIVQILAPWRNFMLVKRPEQQQSEKIRKSRQRAAGSLQIRDINTPFLPVPVSLSVCFRILMSFTWIRLTTSATHHVHRFWEGDVQWCIMKIITNSPQTRSAKVTSLLWKQKEEKVKINSQVQYRYFSTVTKYLCFVTSRLWVMTRTRCRKTKSLYFQLVFILTSKSQQR